MFLFNTRIEDATRLEQTLIGHQTTADWLTRQTRTFAQQGESFYALIVGARGSGKTHLISVVKNRIAKADQLVIAYLGEDEYGIDSYFDFLLRIFKALRRSARSEEDIHSIDDKLGQLKKVEEPYLLTYAEQFLLDYLQGRPLLVLIENIQGVFKGLRSAGQSKWRDFIQKYDNVSMIATARGLFADLQKNNRPFFNFFNITHLEALDVGQVRRLLLALASLEEDEGLSRYFRSPSGQARLQSLYSIFGGNPRHWLAFFESAKSKYEGELGDTLLETVDALNPYFEGFLQNLSPQQQKVIQYLCIQRQPQTGKEIAQSTFLHPTTVSKQLSELTRLAYIHSYKEGRISYYELSDPILRIAVELNEGQDQPVRQFLHFIEPVYKAVAQLDFPESLPFGGEANRDEKSVFYFALPQQMLRKAMVPAWFASESRFEQYRVAVEAKNYAEALSCLTEVAPKEMPAAYYFQLALLHFLNGAMPEARAATQQFLRQSRGEAAILPAAYLYIVLGDRAGLLKIARNYQRLNLKTGAQIIALLILFASAKFLHRMLQENLPEKWAKKRDFRATDLFSISEWLVLLRVKRVERIELSAQCEALQRFFSGRPEFQQGLKFFQLALRYLHHQEHRAIYELAREERLSFEQLILNR